MIISEIQNFKAARDPVVTSAVDILPISESSKQTDIENNHKTSDVNSIQRSEEIKEVTQEKIQRVSELMNDYIQSLQKDLKINVNNETGDIIVKVISGEDGKVIREIPSEELLALAARMEEIAGVIFDQIV